MKSTFCPAFGLEFCDIGSRQPGYERLAEEKRCSDEKIWSDASYFDYGTEDNRWFY